MCAAGSHLRSCTQHTRTTTVIPLTGQKLNYWDEHPVAELITIDSSNITAKSRRCNILNAVSDPFFLKFESGFSRRQVLFFSSPSPGFLLVRVSFEPESGSEHGPGFEVCRYQLGAKIAK